jgi:hypothetical protein
MSKLSIILATTGMSTSWQWFESTSSTTSVQQ